MSKKILILISILFLFSNEVFAACRTYTSQGKKTHMTCTFSDGHSYTYVYNTWGKVSYYVYYDTTNTLTKQSEYTYDENGKQTSYTRWDSAEAIANNTPDYKTESTYDENGSNTYVQYASAESIANNTPDFKQEYTYGEDGTETYTRWHSAEAITNDTPDYKREYKYDDDGRNVSVLTQWYSAESISNNTPDSYQIFSDGQYIYYDKNGNLSPGNGDAFVYDDQGRVIESGWDICS